MTAMIWNRTCAFCEQVAHYLDKFFEGVGKFCVSVGYARAASYMASQGYHEEAKQLMMYKENVNN